MTASIHAHRTRSTRVERHFTVSVFTESQDGVLNRLVDTLSKRRLRIESLTSCECEVAGVYRHTIVLAATDDQIRKVVKQIEKNVDALKAFYHADNETVHQEIALYKLPIEAMLEGDCLENIVRRFQARILALESDYVVIEKTGHEDETRELLDKLEPFGVMEFARSGRVAITKPTRTLLSYLDKSIQTTNNKGDEN